MNISSVCERGKSLWLPGFVLLMSACAVIIDVEVRGGRVTFHFESYLGQLPPGAKPMNLKAHVTLPGVGEFVVDLYDTDGDGKADMGGPIPPDNKFVKGHTFPPITQKDLAVGSGHSHSGDPQPPEARPLTFVIYENPAIPPMPVVFDQSVAAYLADYGLTDIQEGDNTVSALEVLGVVGDSSLPTGVKLDMRLHWNTEAGWVDIEQFPSLSYEFYGLSEVAHTWPHYMEARVVGDAGAVLNWLGHHGVTNLDFEDVQIYGLPSGPAFIHALGIEIHTAGGFAQLSVDGVLSYLTLGW